MTEAAVAPTVSRAEIVEAIYGDGIIGCKGAFAPEWADRLREDIEGLFAEARSRPGGAVPRGPMRWYVEIHPERLRGFVDLATHPWVTAVCSAVLGEDYQFVEVGFDVPLGGAMDQPWHRDFPSPEETYAGRRITSLAINVTAVDTTPDMGPFEIAPGTQWEDGLDFDGRMFPQESEWPRYQALKQRKLPQRGDISARTALAIHRGTASWSDRPRPVLILGALAPGLDSDRYTLTFTKDYFAALPGPLRDHLRLATVVDELTPLVQKHTIEGLLMGVEAPRMG